MMARNEYIESEREKVTQFETREKKKKKQEKAYDHMIFFMRSFS
jgi:hypothetical protein